MSEDEAGYIPTSSDLYNPTGDFIEDTERLAKVVAPLKEGNLRIEKQKEAERQERESNQLAVKESIQEAVAKLPERIEVPQEDGSYIVVRKSEDRLRMARTVNKDIRMDGYHPDFDSMTAYEVITFDRSGNNYTPQTIHIFDLDKLKAGDTSRYWGDARRIHLVPEANMRSFASTNTFEEIPEIAPLTNALPSVMGHISEMTTVK